VKVTARFKDEINTGDSIVPNQQVKIPGMSLGCSISTASILAASMLDHPGHFSLVNTHSKNMAVYYGSIEAETRGTLHSYPFSSEPFIRYRLTHNDFKKMVSVMGALIQVLFNAGAEEIYPHIAGFGAVRNYQEFLQKIPQLKCQDLRIMSVHLFSGCEMGEALHCPADSFGKLKAAPGIYVSDASLLPGATGVNPQGTIMAISRRNILHFLNAGLS
jgi:choline dehydrogenase-like flavoprotein